MSDPAGMTTHIVLLRAVNVGGTGKLPMADLRAMCTRVGLANPRTYIASGNLVVESRLPGHEVRALLEAELANHAGKPVGVFVLSTNDLERILAGDPFPDAPGNRVNVLFLGTAVEPGMIDSVKHRTNEEIVPGQREIYVHYPDGQGVSRLVIPASDQGTLRNRNTVEKLVQLAAKQG